MAGGGDSKWPAYLCVLLVGVGLFCMLLYLATTSQPSLTRATVESATLSKLTVDVSNASAASISYHLAVSLKLYNPGDQANIYYDSMDAELRFSGAIIGPAANETSPSVFFQGSKTGRDVKLEFDYGRRGGVSVAGDLAAELEKGMRSVGTVTMELELDVHVRVRYGQGAMKMRQKPRIWCSMSIPVKPDGRGALASADRCRVKN